MFSSSQTQEYAPRPTPGVGGVGTGPNSRTEQNSRSRLDRHLRPSADTTHSNQRVSLTLSFTRSQLSRRSIHRVGLFQEVTSLGLAAMLPIYQQCILQDHKPCHKRTHAMLYTVLLPASIETRCEAYRRQPFCMAAVTHWEEAIAPMPFIALPHFTDLGLISSDCFGVELLDPGSFAAPLSVLPQFF